MRMMKNVVRLSPLEAIRRRVYVTDSFTILTPEVGTFRLVSCTVFMDGSRTLFNREAPTDWSLVTAASVHAVRSCDLLFS